MEEFIIFQQLENRSKFIQHVTLELFETSNKPMLSCENNGAFFPTSWNQNSESV